mmetsp:Transcript_103609/g.211440  ORF Transcript_103609/g.211440 Transcript_103609/m.211440 type:complete len:145 (-) Transcript_103609:637-1071(-)
MVCQRELFESNLVSNLSKIWEKEEESLRLWKMGRRHMLTYLLERMGFGLKSGRFSTAWERVLVALRHPEQQEVLLTMLRPVNWPETLFKSQLRQTVDIPVLRVTRLSRLIGLRISKTYHTKFCLEKRNTLSPQTAGENASNGLH